MTESDPTPSRGPEKEQPVSVETELTRKSNAVHQLGQRGVSEAQRTAEPTEKEIQAWLNTNVEDRFRQLGLPRMYGQALKRDGAFTFRQVLMRGDGRRVDGLGPKGKKVLDTLMQNDLGIELKDNPTVEDIASYCKDLSEVDGRILVKRIRAGVSVEDYLQLDTFEEMFTCLDLRYLLEEDTKQAVARGARIRLAEFAAEFEQIKQAI